VRCGCGALPPLPSPPLPSSPLPSPPLPSGFCLLPCCCVVEVECFPGAHFLCVGTILLLHDRAQCLESFFLQSAWKQVGFFSH
jgi:hypothetical protein